MRFRTTVGVMLLASIGGAGISALVGSSRAQTDEPRHNQRVVARDVVAAYSGLRDDGVGPVHEDDVERLRAATRAADLEKSNGRLAYDAPDLVVHVAVPDHRRICTAQRETSGVAATGCVSATGPQTTPALNVQLVGKDLWRLVALVPDGVTDVTVATGDGERHLLDVNRNVGVALVTSVPVSYSWVAEDGSTGQQDMTPLA